MKICYKPHRFDSKTSQLLELVDSICDDYINQGFALSLRQLYYRLVTQNIFPNHIKSYKRLIRIVTEGRLAGRIDWDAIEDRSRNLKKHTAWNSPSHIIRAVASQYALDPWLDQPEYLEVWVEKDALIGVVEHACEEYRVPCFSCRGYTSQTEIWEAANRFRDKMSDGKEITVIHLGDHDPSGIDMTRDIEDRFDLFGAEVTVQRIALSYNQVKTYKLPPNPVKSKDSRTPDYESKYGKESWELDALEPDVIVKLIENTVATHVDLDAWDASMETEEGEKAELQLLSSNYDAAIKHVKGIK